MAPLVRSHVRKSGSERRMEILEATLRLISEHGVEGVRVARIAEAVGVTPGAIYRHFDSRASLVFAAHRLANERSIDLIRSSEGGDVLERLENAARAHEAWAQKYFNTVVRPFFMELASTPDPEVPDRLVVKSFGSFQAILEMAEEGIRRGIIRADVSPEDVAWAFHMVIWTEDIAVMAGEQQAVANGTFHRLISRLLDSFRADQPKPESTDTFCKTPPRLRKELREAR